MATIGRAVVAVAVLVAALLVDVPAAPAAPVDGPGRRAVAQGLIADYDGDGRSDWVAINDFACIDGDDGHFAGPWYWNVQYSGNGQTRRVVMGDCNRDRPVVGDFNGDHRTDYAYVRWNDPKPGLLTWHVSYSSGGGETMQWGANDLGDQPVAGDFDGDGRTDFAVLRPNDPEPGDDTWVIRYAKGGADAHVPWGANDLGDQPVAGDFDGDGRTDFAVVRPHTYGNHWTWAIKYSGGGVYQEAWGLSDTYLPISGDYNDDGRTDLTVVYEPQDSSVYTWFYALSNGVTGSFSWGGVQTSPGGLRWGDYPLSGDFGGDGSTDWAVLRTLGTERWDVAVAGSSTVIHHSDANPTDVDDLPFPQQRDDGWTG